MAQSTILASGTTAATSSEIALAADETVTISLFADRDVFQPEYARFEIRPVTPGTTGPIGELSIRVQQIQLTGPGTYEVSRPLMSTPVGICLDA